ncbi:Polysaccharide deacetylase [Halovivax ruber XH-70]|uniref:Polysaccharide deacetylase n=1 Tax=Halovivax ruber (strain DSM 18193 / JCM 13892 / XH-70) TaxID=797302 RepID=L0I6U0_HALRX|nr:polysaccharide deacetylase family protein [Halovivax ruber]AGB15255.1 Polysaccharide deacetylase [Halovivax ruber XH-70]
MPGTVTISIELELGWGVAKYGKLDKLSDGRMAETQYLSRLLERCDDHDVPITFDVVGHLFHENCAGHHGGPHPDDWWDIDPGTSVDEDPAFYAPDLVEDIRSRRTTHEICTHTYSHIECDAVDPTVVEWEVDRSRRVHERNGVPAATSIVPPRHGTPPSETLAEGGIRVKRSPHYRAPGERRPSSDVRKLYEILLERHPTVSPREMDGIIETYSPEYTTLAVPYLQTGQYSPHPVYRPIPHTFRQRLHAWNLRRGVDAAVQGGDVHYWCHLYDLANEQQWPQIDDFLGYLAKRRDRGDVEIRPMRDLPAICGQPTLNEADPAEQPGIVIE